MSSLIRLLKRHPDFVTWKEFQYSEGKHKQSGACFGLIYEERGIIFALSSRIIKAPKFSQYLAYGNSSRVK